MGSLFQLRDYWYTTFTDEEFSAAAFTVGDVDNEDTVDKIVIGSFQGNLRIIRPGTARGQMSAADVLYEKNYGEPILQVECAPLLPPSTRGGPCKNLIAVLFPRRLQLLLVLAHGKTAAEQQAEHATTETGEDAAATALNHYCECKVYYETHFDHTLYNFVTGRFGRSPYAMVCVQSMDGQLSIVDHNKVLYRRFLSSNQFLVPGCLAYCAQRDYFLTNNSSLFVMCYSYGTLTNSTGSEEKQPRADQVEGEDSSSGPYSPRYLSPNDRMGGGGGGMKLMPTWAFNAGDDVVDIAVCRVTRGLGLDDAEIVVLCPYTLHILSLSGECRMMKRLDVETTALCVYRLPAINADNLLIGTCTGSINVYTDVSLEWSAKMTAGHPIRMAVATMCGVQGMIVTLTSQATLSINYLGTDPADGPTQPLESKTVKYADMSRELRHVQRSIKRYAEEDTKALPSGSRGSTAAAADADSGDKRKEKPPPKPVGLQLAFEPISLSAVRLTSENAITANLRVTMGSGGGPLDVVSELTVEISTTAPVQPTPSQHVMAQLMAGAEAVLPVRFAASPDRDSIIPSSLIVTAVAVYKNRLNESCSVQCELRLPLALVARPVPPMKNPAFSVQLNTEKTPPPSLLDIFPDMVPFGNVTTNVLSIRYLNEADATVLVSKNAARFKVQGSTMEGLWLLSSELMHRIRQHYGEPHLAFELPDDVPLPDFLAVIETHVKIRQELTNATNELEKAAVFFRAVEKRQLARFRDRNPTSSEAVDLLFAESYALLQRRTEAVVTAKARQRQACAMLNCCAQLMYEWLILKYGRTLSKPEDRDILRGLLRCEITDNVGVSWEETMEAALVHVMKIKSASKTTAQELTESVNSATLKKHIRLLVQTVKDGKSLTETSA